MMDLLTSVEVIHKKEADLHAMREKLDTSTSAGKLIFYVVGTLTEYEREVIRERTLEGLEAARRQGRIGGRPRILNQRQRDLVLRMRSEGERLREIARTFNVSVGTVHRVVRENPTSNTTSKSKQDHQPSD